MAHPRRELLVALPIVASLAIGCAGAPRADEGRGGDPHVECDARLAEATAKQTADRERLEREARTAREEADLLRRDLQRRHEEVVAARERTAAQEEALEAALEAVRRGQEELAALRERGADSEVAAAAELLRQKDEQLRLLRLRLAEAQGGELTPLPDNGSVRLASMDLEVPVATVDGEPFSRREFCEYLYRDLGTPGLLELFVNRALVVREARRRGIAVNDVDCAVWVEEQRVQHVREAGTLEAFKKKISEAGYDEEAWAARLRFQARPTLLLRRLVELERTTPEGREAFEARLREEYQRTYSERVRAGHIFIRAERDATEAEVEAAHRKAQAAADQVRRGVPFADVARRFSEDAQTRNLGGTLGTFDRGRFAKTPELNTALFTLPVGEVSQPVRTPLGFHVVLVEDRTPPARPFDEAVKRELANRLSKQPPSDAEMEALVGRLRARAHVVRTLTFD
ncbi:MAG: peptidylprolyl isomerase [Planctomycetes bacterium]|nr:peptidylprolyl isomerase [Planctomycetota bacterium]